MDLPVYKLVIADDENSDVEVDFVALVDKPAIERNFLAFRAEFVEPGPTETEDEFIGRCMGVLVGEEGYDQTQAAAICYSKWNDRGNMGADFQESITDIPDDVRSNARNAVEWADKNGWGSCGTAVGKRRASQLADPGGAVSLDTVRRMYSYLSRHAVDLENSKGYSDGCGKLMYDAWGGKAGLRWSESVLKREAKLSFAIQDEDQRIITGPLMLANKPILRRDKYGEYYVYFEPDTIKQIAQKFFKKGYQSNVNLMHNDGMVVEGLTMFESWIVDKERGIKPLRGFEDVPDGSWFGSFIVENDEVWKGIKDGTFKGFSVEGVFNYVRAGKSEEDIKMEKIIEILNELQ